MSGTIKDWRTQLAWELRAAIRLTILGVGNPDRGDDGAGSRCIRRLAQALGHSPFFFCQDDAPEGANLSANRVRLVCRPRRAEKGEIRESGKPAAVQVLDGREAPESLTGPIRRFRPSHVLIVDAVSTGNPPGSVFFVDPGSIGEDDLGTHRIPLSRLVRYLEETVGCRVLLLGIEPRSLGPGKGLTRPVGQGARAVADSLAGWLRP